MLLMIACSGTAATPAEEQEPAPPPPVEAATAVEEISEERGVAEASFDSSYSGWDAVLKQHVSRTGLVDYEGLRSEPRLTAFVESIAKLSPQVVAEWSADQQKAFYINAYNALTFQTILDAWPVASIRDIQPDPWEDARWVVAGRTMSLNQIEHSKLRGDLKEPRVHFVLVCAAVSCPVLPNRTVLPQGLDTQLDALAAAFFNDASRNRIDPEGKKVYLSKILEWYGDDFIGAEAPELPGLTGLSERETAVLRTMAKHVAPSQRATLEAGGLTIVYNDYNWNLNSQ